VKKVTAFVGSARKKHTHDAVSQFLNNLQSLGDVESEIVVLSDYRVETCRGYSKLRNASVETSFTRIPRPARTGCAQVALSATRYFLTTS
jgi:hypothetical protein